MSLSARCDHARDMAQMYTVREDEPMNETLPKELTAEELAMFKRCGLVPLREGEPYAVKDRIIATIDTLSARAEQAERALKLCEAAMRRSVDEGSTDHLDCGEDGGKYWHEAIARAAAESAKGKA